MVTGTTVPDSPVRLNDVAPALFAAAGCVTVTPKLLGTEIVDTCPAAFAAGVKFSANWFVRTQGVLVGHTCRVVQPVIGVHTVVAVTVNDTSSASPAATKLIVPVPAAKNVTGTVACPFAPV